MLFLNTKGKGREGRWTLSDILTFNFLSIKYFLSIELYHLKLCSSGGIKITDVFFLLFSSVENLYTFTYFPGSSEGKESTCSAGDLGRVPGWEDSLSRACQPIPVFLPGESTWTEEPGGLSSMGWQSQTQLKRSTAFSSCSLNPLM